MGPPAKPGATTVSCLYSTAEDCWVQGDFTASVTASTGGMGSLLYQICRSNDSTSGFAGCDVNLTLTGGTSILVSGAHLPADGFRRAYWFQATDSAGALSGWNTPRFVRVDRNAPTVSADNASDQWFATDRTATVSAADTVGGAGANSGLAEVRYNWNAALDAGCTTGTVIPSGTTLPVPVGDNLLYLCARDNVSRVTQWSGRYRATEVLTLTGTISPHRASYLGSFTYTATATGGTPSSTVYAFFRRKPDEAWIPDVDHPVWAGEPHLHLGARPRGRGHVGDYICAKTAHAPERTARSRRSNQRSVWEPRPAQRAGRKESKKMCPDYAVMRRAACTLGHSGSGRTLDEAAREPLWERLNRGAVP